MSMSWYKTHGKRAPFVGEVDCLRPSATDLEYLRSQDDFFQSIMLPQGTNKRKFEDEEPENLRQRLRNAEAQVEVLAHKLRRTRANLQCVRAQAQADIQRQRPIATQHPPSESRTGFSAQQPSVMLEQENQEDFGTDALPHQIQAEDFGADALHHQALHEDFGTDALLHQIQAEDFSADALHHQGLGEDFSADALHHQTQQAEDFSADALHHQRLGRDSNGGAML